MKVIVDCLSIKLLIYLKNFNYNYFNIPSLLTFEMDN